MREQVPKGNLKLLDMMHHFTSGLKSLYTQMAYDGIELVRVNCGGAGYSVWSYLPQIYKDYSPVPVYEGDNTVMAQQTWTYIDHKLKKIASGKKINGIFAYLNDLDKLCGQTSIGAKTIAEFMTMKNIETAMAIKAAWAVREVSTKLSKKDGKEKLKQMNELYAVDILYASKCHHQFLSLTIFNRVIDNHKFKDAKIKDLMHLLGKLYALKCLTADSHACYETGFFGQGSKDLIL